MFDYFDSVGEGTQFVRCDYCRVLVTPSYDTCDAPDGSPAMSVVWSDRQGGTDCERGGDAHYADPFVRSDIELFSLEGAKL